MHPPQYNHMRFTKKGRRKSYCFVILAEKNADSSKFLENMMIKLCLYFRNSIYFQFCLKFQVSGRILVGFTEEYSEPCQTSQKQFIIIDIIIIKQENVEIGKFCVRTKRMISNTLRENYPNTGFFLVRIFLYSD